MAATLILATLLLFGSSSPQHGSHHQTRHFGRWKVHVQTDRFRDETLCQISGHHLAYQRGVVELHFGGKTDTADATYRLDHGPPVRAADVRRDLAKQGISVYRDELDNPSGGIIRIPVESIVTANFVEVETHPGKQVAKFNVDGLQSALKFATSAGCTL